MSGQGARLVRGAAQLAMGHGAAQLLGLMRNFAVARLLGPEDFGVAALFAVTVAVVEAATDVGLDKYLVQNCRGDDPALQRTIHGLLAIRGIIIALIVLTIGYPLAALFDVPEAANAFRCMALVPLIKGCAHTDLRRINRSLDFRRDAIAMVVSQAAGLVVAVGLAFVLRSYWAMLWGVVAYTLAYVVTTHRLAARPYRLGFDAVEAHRMLVFAWPLTLNGLIVVAGAQGDRIVVGALLGVVTLGLYAVIMMMLNVVISMALQVLSGVGLPWLSAAQGDRAEFGRRHGWLGTVFALLVASAYPVLAVGGVEAVALVFGEPYRPAPGLIAILGLVAVLRVLRGWHMTSALALGDTRSILLGNMVRPSGLVAASLAANAGFGVTGVALGLVLGECLALTLTAFILHRATMMGIAPSLSGPLLAIGTAIASSVWIALQGPASTPDHLPPILAAAVGCIAIAAGTCEGRTLIMRLVSRLPHPPFISG